MNKAEKIQFVTDLRAELAGAASLVVADFTGLDVSIVGGLRSEARKKGVNCRVIKNTMIRLAIADTSMDSINPLLSGPTVLLWHNEEPAAAAKIMKDFVKDLPSEKEVSIKGGWIDGDLLDEDGAIKMADMLSKDELRSQLLGLAKAVPGKYLALMLTAPKKFLGVLEARKKQLEDEAA